MFKRTQTVDGIMASFQKTIDQLDTLQVNASTDISTLTAQKAEIDVQISTAEREMTRAKAISSSLSNLIRPEA